ncbi:membrane protein insertion efficiency factor YidD [Tenuifilum thalassicum]|uniref:Putative membrane protein insertion efficiency factor n=1 Tax=Tenuifilum thalassicum TaxID=2590900 RepID=A0A7D3XFM3_9BACT|nr:membrane protein insertion efficiency factor YidD [Tenuifilum thalassicum]QKG81172.1 membrane protein insertion efficiency factor YidD [Tenuifilum thalassicum]
MKVIILSVWRFITRLLAFIPILIVKLYQIFLSPYLPNSCRFTPTCSAYSIKALRKHGFFKGLWLSVKRISRCHPWGDHGYDPVP